MDIIKVEKSEKEKNERLILELSDIYDGWVEIWANAPFNSALREVALNRMIRIKVVYDRWMEVQKKSGG